MTDSTAERFITITAGSRPIAVDVGESKVATIRLEIAFGQDSYTAADRP